MREIKPCPCGSKEIESDESNWRRVDTNRILFVYAHDTAGLLCLWPGDERDADGLRHIATIEPARWIESHLTDAHFDGRKDDAAALREALERLVEAIPEYAYDGEFDKYFCPSCGRIKGNGHARGCKRGAAIAAARAALEGTK